MQEFKEPSMTIEIAAHSIAEEHLFIDSMNCPTCGEGPVERIMHFFPCTWIAKCKSCNITVKIVSDESLIMTDQYNQTLFSRDSDSKLKRVHRYQRRYNRTDEPSKIIELTQWINFSAYWLSTMKKLDEQGERSSDRYIFSEFELVQCLQEALKFYDENEEYPPRDAFFSEDTFKQYMDDRRFFSQKILRSILSNQRSLETIEEDLDRIEDKSEK